MLEAISDLDTQAAYLRDLCNYLDNYLGDLQKVESPGILTEHQHGIIYAATNRLSGQIRTNLDEAMRHAQTWAKEVRDAVNGYA